MSILTAAQAAALRSELARLQTRAPSTIPEFNTKRAERIAEIEGALDTGVIVEPEHDPLLERVLKRTRGGDKFGR